MNLNRFNLVVIGAGALGCAVLPGLMNEKLGTLKIVDGDIVTDKNLKNQSLYTFEDAKNSVYKAEAAASRLRKADRAAKIIAFPFYVGERRIDDILKGADLVIDLTDNVETRLIINDACSKGGVPLLVASLRSDKGFFYIINWKNACFNCIYRNSSLKESDGCSGIPSRSAVILGKAILNEVRGFLLHKKDEFLFNSLSIKDREKSAIKLSKDPSCETCSKHEYNHGLDAGFIQMCGDGIKFSLQKDVDIQKIRMRLPVSAVKDGGSALIFENGGRSVFISKSGDFLFNGYTKEMAKNFIDDVLT